MVSAAIFLLSIYLMEFKKADMIFKFSLRFYDRFFYFSWIVKNPGKFVRASHGIVMDNVFFD